MQIGLNKAVNVFRRLLYGGTTKLRSYELICLDHWRELLSPEATDVLNRQLQLFDVIQRLSQDKLVTFHRLDSECWPHGTLFETRGVETMVATVWLKSGRPGEQVIRVDIILNLGCLSSLEFSISPKGSLGAARSHQIEIIKIKEWLDPMAADEKRIPERSAVTLTGWVKEWSDLRKVHLREPLSSAKRETILQQFGIKVPPDYKDLLVQTEGLKAGNCTILGASQIRKIVLPLKTLCVLAEVDEQGVIGVEQENEEYELFFLDNEADDFRSVGFSLRAAVEEKLGWRTIFWEQSIEDGSESQPSTR